jgi:hypothetical protein
MQFIRNTLGQDKRGAQELLGLVAIILTALLAACGGGGSGGSNGGQAYYYYTCTDGTTRSSTVSQAAAQAQCPSVAYSVICADQSTKTSTVSQATANALCPVDVVSNVATPTYTDEKLVAFNQLNSDRAQCGFGKLQQNAKLDVAAQGHADWLAANPFKATSHVQDPSTGKGVVTGVQPDDRLINAGYFDVGMTNYVGSGEEVAVPAWGTALSCPYCTNNASYGNTELSARNGVRQLYATIYHLFGVTNLNRDVGLGVAIGDSSTSGGTRYIKNVVIDSGTVTGWVRQSIPADAVLTFPCQGIVTTPVFGGEAPEPFPKRSSKEYGQPIYVMGADGTTVTLNAASSTMTPAGGVPVATTLFNSAVDPLPSTDSRRVKSNQVFLVPIQRLLDNTTYTVVLNGTNTGLVTNANPTGAFYKTFTFSTATNTTL